MGAPMTRRLIEAGHCLTVWSHNHDKAAHFAHTHGCALADTPADVALRSGTIFVCVGDTAMSQSTILGKQGLVKTTRAGSLIVDCSTISPMASREMAFELQKKQV